MARTNYSSPLDEIRRLNEAARNMEVLAVECPEEALANGSQFDELIKKLDLQHPLLEEEVIVYGSPLIPCADADGNMHPLSLAADEYSMPTEEKMGIRGIYYGLGMRPAYSQDLNKVIPVAAHLVMTGQYQYADEFYNWYNKKNIEHIWVVGSEIVPVLPVHGHNLYDLRKDALIEKFNSIAFEGTASVPDIVRQLGAVANDVLGGDDGFNIERTRQRISYLNSLELLSSLVLTSTEVVVGNRDSYLAGEADELGIVDKTTPLKMRGGMFDALPGFKRLPDDSINFAGRAPELFVVGSYYEGAHTFMPVKDILDIVAV